MSKIYFPGGNTGCGFFSLFSNIVPSKLKSKEYIYILKGGPGVGKNTLMRKICNKAEAKGLETEEFRCASDPDSLDAVRIPYLGIVVLDGTAPHSIDPIIPGIYEEILDLGRFKNRENFLLYTDKLENLFAENKKHYVTAYSFLAAALELKKTALKGAREVMDLSLIHDFTMDFWVKPKKIDPRKLFLEAITPKGYINFTDINRGDFKHLSFPGITGEVILNEATATLGKCADMIFADPLIPTNTREIILNDSALLLTGGTGDGECDDFLKAPLPSYVLQCKEKVDELIQLAIDEIHACKALHDEIEAIYRPHVDYAMVDKLSEGLLNKI